MMGQISAALATTLQGKMQVGNNVGPHLFVWDVSAGCVHHQAQGQARCVLTT
jgi:hypothetical protein